MTNATTLYRAGRLRRALLSAAVAFSVAGSGLAVAASEAEAWYYGRAYLVVNNWRCVGGGTVTAIYGAVDNAWTGGDAGDNIIWPRVRVGDLNTFNGWAQCSRPWWRGGPYRINVAWWQFRPSWNNQTFWY